MRLATSLIRVPKIAIDLYTRQRYIIELAPKEQRD